MSGPKRAGAALFDEAEHYRRLAASVVIAFVLAMVTLPHVAGFQTDAWWLLRLYAVVGIPAATLPYIAWRNLKEMRPAVETTCLAMASLPAFIVCTFVAMRTNLSLQDALLVRWDQALGLDWPAFVRLVDTSPLASRLLGTAYESAFLQIVFVPLFLCACGFPGRAYRLIACYGLLVAISALVSVYFPSVSAYGGYHFDGSALQNVNSHNGYFFLDSFYAVRSEANFVLSQSTAAGIVTFPSIHAGTAALLAWAAWPSRVLRYPIVALNVLMAIGTVTHGAHYFVDVLAGFAVAALSIRCSSLLANWLSVSRVRQNAFDPAR